MNTNNSDDRAMDREIDHANKMQEQRRKIKFSGGRTYEIQDTQDKEKPQSTAN